MPTHGGKRHVMVPRGHSMAKNDTSWDGDGDIDMQITLGIFIYEKKNLTSDYSTIQLVANAF
jgi:hypothetical protein